jgi:hypothetical protein
MKILKSYKLRLYPTMDDKLVITLKSSGSMKQETKKEEANL